MSSFNFKFQSFIAGIQDSKNRFYISNFCPWNSLYLLISSRKFFVGSFEIFYIGNHIIQNKNSCPYSILYMLYLILSSYGTGYDFQNGINKVVRGHVLIMKLGESVQFLTISIMIVVVFFLTHVHQVDKFSLYSHFSERLYYL